MKQTAQREKWNNIIYSGNCIRAITKLLKKTKIKIAFKTYITMKTYSTKHQPPTNKKLSLPCLDCKNVYVGQKEHLLYVRYKERVRNIIL
jgi:hypothetical protein